MFRIKVVSGPRFCVEFGQSTAWHSHNVSVITGPNGSGKTELLTVLASWFQGNAKTQGISVSWDRDGNMASGSNMVSSVRPVRVITQTFSPFSRFAAPREDSLSLTDVYGEGQQESQRYRSIGFHKRSRYIGGVLSKHTLEQGLYRISEAPEQARAVAGVLEVLGFKDRLHLVYRKYPVMREILSAFRANALREYLHGLDSPRVRTGTALYREVRSAGSGRLADLLGGALELLAEQLDRSSFDLFFSARDGRPSEDFAVMQALALLRRLRVLRLDRCMLTLASGDGSIDLADASSGQQQMLCSMFGLVAELRSNSLVLIDEPELSLHPTWQMLFLERLQAVLSKFHGCHVLIATHSPLIVQSALQQSVEVIQLEANSDDHLPFSSGISGQRQVSVEGTLLDVFHTPIAGSVYLANEIFDIVTESEDGGRGAREAALVRLKHLRQIYSGKEQGTDDRALRIIDEAIVLVADDDYDVERTDAV